MSFTNRYIARIAIEAETPFAVGSGEKGLNTDRLVAKDANGLPCIPGTGLAGVLRHSFGVSNWVADVFGSGGNEGKGSRLIVSSAFLIGEDGRTVMDGLRSVDLDNGFYSYFHRLPERDHVRINHKGAADSENRGKFDEELVHKGTRFVFELEFLADDSQEDKENWEKILSAIASPAYRIGAGTRKGFGKLKIVSSLSKFVSWDLRKEDDLKLYLKKSSSLNDDVSEWSNLSIKADSDLNGWQDFSIGLKGKDFFSFSAGFGDGQADNKPKKERYFDWSSGRPELRDKDYTLIPATSIKGALSHRVAYHYNVLTGNTIGKNEDSGLTSNIDLEKVERSIRAELNIEKQSFPSDSPEWEKLERQIENLNIGNISEWEDFKNHLNAEIREKKGTTLPVGENNKAVQELFGFAKNSEEEVAGQRGRVIIQDIYLAPQDIKEKVFSHTSIDRFTNGTIDGALFQEKVSYAKEKEITIPIWVEKEALKDTQVKLAFERALDDLKSGRLALGGSTTKGHGIFKTTEN